MEDLRSDVERSEDNTKTAQSLTQLIERYGARGWVDALLENFGPALMLQLEDTANFLERVEK